MKYNRNKLIYNDMSPRLRDKFSQTFNIIPSLLKNDEEYKFDECMKKFIENNPHDLELRRSCEIFPELRNIPHPDRIPERWGLNSIGRERMKDGYIEKIEEENAELHEKNDELKIKNDGLADNITDLEKKLDNQKEEISVLTKENAELKIDNTELKKDNLAILEEKTVLAAELTELRTNFMNLIHENRGLQKELTDLTEENSELKNELRNLQIDFVNLKAEKDELNDQLSISQTKVGCLTEENTELKRKISEPPAQFAPITAVNHEPGDENNEPEPEFTDPELLQVQITPGDDSVENGSEAALVSSIYQKFFVSPLAKNRYHLLSEEEKDWICENADLSEIGSTIFKLCCEHDSLKEASEKTDLSYSKIKRTSTAIVEKIHIALDRVIPKDKDHEITKG